MLGTIWNSLLFYPFLNLLVLFYAVLGNNLGWAVIVVAILIRLALIPSTRSQMNMTKKMSGLRPQLDKIQKKYGNNQQKLAEEQMKLYKEVGYNPLGCLSSFLPQILVLYAMIQVINVVTGNNFEGLYPFIRDFAFNGASDVVINTKFLIIDLSKTYTAIAQDAGYFASEGIAYFALAALVGVVQFFSTKFMQIMQGQVPSKKKGKKDAEPSPEDMQNQMMGSMNAIFPIMTFVITLSAPAVLGLYWLVQSLMLVVQYYLIDREKFLSVFKNKAK